MSEKILVTHCSPTLAGMKTGNLFSCTCSRNQLAFLVTQWNRMLNSKGVYIRVMRFRNNTALVYVFRKKKLLQSLKNREVRRFLEECGYTCPTVTEEKICCCDQCGYSCEVLEQMIERLSERLCEYEDFPHEIGVFLGYPFEDVKGFIDNKGKNYKYAGFWKVYSDETAARRLFSKYRKCTDIYCQRLQEGTCLQRLTVEGRHLA